MFKVKLHKSNKVCFNTHIVENVKNYKEVDVKIKWHSYTIVSYIVYRYLIKISSLF